MNARIVQYIRLIYRQYTKKSFDFMLFTVNRLYDVHSNCLYVLTFSNDKSANRIFIIFYFHVSFITYLLNTKNNIQYLKKICTKISFKSTRFDIF